MTELEKVVLGVVAALPVPDPVDVKDEESDCEPLAACEAVRDTLAVSVALSEPGWLPVAVELIEAAWLLEAVPDCVAVRLLVGPAEGVSVSVLLSDATCVGETLALGSWDGVAVRVRPPETVCDSEGFCETDPVSVKDAVPVVEALNDCAWLMVVVTELVNI